MVSTAIPSSLYRLAAATGDIAPQCAALHTLLKPSPANDGSLRDLSALVSGDRRAMAMALCEVAQHENALRTLQEAPELRGWWQPLPAYQDGPYLPLDANAKTALSAWRSRIHPDPDAPASTSTDPRRVDPETRITLFDDIERSAGAIGVPFPSVLTTYTSALDFFVMGGIILRKIENRPALHDPLLAGLFLALFNAMDWQPLLIDKGVINEAAERQKAGERIIAVDNHRNHFDSPKNAVILKRLSPRIVAKSDLLRFPILGWYPGRRPLEPSAWTEDGLLRRGRHILLERGNRDQAIRELNEKGTHTLRDGHALMIYPEGTRMPTPDRKRETGLLPHKKGVYHLIHRLLKEGERVSILSLSTYGLGMMMPKDLRQPLWEGVMRHQPVVTWASEILEIAPQGQESDAAFIEGLRRRVWWSQWSHLAPLQGFMNAAGVF